MTSAVIHDAQGCGVWRLRYLAPMRNTLIPLLTAFCLGLFPAKARADIHALLIGVGDYEFLDADLQGPGFDVALMAQTLVARGVAPDAITALTTMPEVEGMPAGVTLAAPRKATIMAEMAALTEKAQPGDTVVFYFSGHGSQAPDTNGDEQGGADEILLPMDAAGWKGAIAAVENALVDDELHDWARALTAKGVKLVGLIDACHSGTGFRALSGEGRARVMPPNVLDVPEDWPNAAISRSDSLTGEFAFLYSSQSDQRSFEYPLGDTGRWHGAFTLAMSQVLREAPQASWGQVLAATRDRMTQGSARQQPDGEGPMLDQPVFGTGDGSARFALTAGSVQAGLLQGLTSGDRVALYDAPAGGAILAEARLVNVEAGSATLDLGNVPLPANAAWAEVVEPAPPAPLRLAPSLRVDPADGRDYKGVELALAAMLRDGIVVQDANHPDLVPLLTEGTLALAGSDGVLDPSGAGSSPRAIPHVDEDSTAAAMRLLENAAHATRVRAVLTRLGAGRGLLGGPPITIKIDRKPGAKLGGDCARGSLTLPFDAETGVRACDELWLTLENTSGRVQDVTVFYLAQDFTLTPIWPVRNLSNRLALGESTRVGLRIDSETPETFANEEILIVALSPEVNAARANLSALATPDTLRAAPDSGGDTALAMMARLLEPDAGQMRNFSTKRPALTLLRQPVLLHPSTP